MTSMVSPPTGGRGVCHLSSCLIGDTALTPLTGSLLLCTQCREGMGLEGGDLPLPTHFPLPPFPSSSPPGWQ